MPDQQHFVYVIQDPALDFEQNVRKLGTNGLSAGRKKWNEPGHGIFEFAKKICDSWNNKICLSKSNLVEHVSETNSVCKW